MFSRLFILSLTLLSFASAQAPKKVNMMELKSLWDRSPFTTKPVAAQERNALEDWALAGVTASPDGGYTISIINKKDRNDRKRIHSSGTYAESGTASFKVIQVTQPDPFDYKQTRVKLSMGSKVGWVEYEDKLLQIKPTAAPAARPATNRSPAALKSLATPKNAPPTSSKTAIQRPRVRRVPPKQ